MTRIYGRDIRLTLWLLIAAARTYLPKLRKQP